MLQLYSRSQMQLCRKHLYRIMYSNFSRRHFFCCTNDLRTWLIYQESFIKQTSPCISKYIQDINSTNQYRNFSKSSSCRVPLELHDPLKDASFLEKLKYNIKLNMVIKPALYGSGMSLYTEISEKIDYKEFFSYFQLSDTFGSWVNVIELHVWLCMVRVMTEGKEGLHLRDCIVEAMWKDVQLRLKKIKEFSLKQRNDIIKDVNAQFQTAVIAYDEGLLNDDKVLAGALWRTFFCYNCKDPRLIEILVNYVRRQIVHLDSISYEEIFTNGKISWIPLKESIEACS